MALTRYRGHSLLYDIISSYECPSIWSISWYQLIDVIPKYIPVFRPYTITYTYITHIHIRCNAAGNHYSLYISMYSNQCLQQKSLTFSGRSTKPYHFPCVEVSAIKFLLVRLSKVNVQRLTLVDVRTTVGRHLDDCLLGYLPHRLVQTLYLVRNAINLLLTFIHVNFNKMSQQLLIVLKARASHQSD